MKKTKMPSFVTLLILTLITVILWVMFDVYRLLNQTPAPVVPDSVSAKLDPTLDQVVINDIESRIHLDDSQIPDNVATQQVNTSQASQVRLPVATPQSTIAPSPTP